MKTKLMLITLLSLSLFFTACGELSTSDEIDEAEILNIVDEIKESFFDGEIDSIMEHYDEEFMHDGYFKIRAEMMWQQNYQNYDRFDFEDFRVELDGNYAIAYFTLNFFNNEDIISFEAPSQYGILSYFHYSSGEWKIYGNHDDDGSSHGYSLTVDSEPQGAKIYINDEPIFQSTPITLNFLPAGEINLKLYKYSYNEWDTTLTVPQTYNLDKTLEFPGYPRPEIIINLPVNEAHYDEPTIEIDAVIKIVDEDGVQEIYENGEYVLEINSIEETYTTTEGYISQLINIQSGPNSIRMRATGVDGNTGWSEPLVVYGDF